MHFMVFMVKVLRGFRKRHVRLPGNQKIRLLSGSKSGTLTEDRQAIEFRNLNGRARFTARTGE
jgi:hypothetical protein